MAYDPAAPAQSRSRKISATVPIEDEIDLAPFLARPAPAAAAEQLACV